MVEIRDRVSAVMSRDVVSIDGALTLSSVAAVLADLEIGVALVAGNDDSIAVVSERDVVRAIADGIDPDDVWASDVAAQRVVFARSNERIIEVADRMVTEGVRHVVIEDGGTVIGMVSMRDVLRVMVESARVWS